ncbi:MAG: LamG-like jellyroll fold domain-containing protein [Rhizobiaceae bacterium]
MTRHLKWGAVIVFVALVLILLNRQQNTHESAFIPGAYVQIPFEGNIKNIGSTKLSGEIKDGEMRYSAGLNGQSYYAQGDGSWLEFQNPDISELAELVEVSFDFKPENWTNPYKKGSASKTIVVVSGRDNNRIVHLAFSISGGDQPSVSVYIQGKTGAKKRLNSEAGSVSWNWHNVKLSVDRKRGKSILYLDGTKITSANIVPVVIENGFHRIKFGTWYKQNQAYRGLVDNFVVSDVTDSSLTDGS